LPGRTLASAPVAPAPSVGLDAITSQRRAAIQRSVSERNAGFFEAEAAKLESWSDDLKIGLEREIKELERLIKEARREAITALTLEAKLAAQKRIRSLESTRNDKRRSLFEAQDRVDRQRDELISAIEGKLTQGTDDHALFTIRWTLRG
jgi:adenine-specific DNA-methyltransferase